MKRNADTEPRFDMSMAPRKEKWFLTPVKKLLCADAKKHKPQIFYDGTENMKGPFLLLCNHNAFLDFKIASTLLGKNKANYVVAVDGFIGREGIMRNVGCIGKRKFTNDTTLVKNLKKSVNMGNVAVIYPEARYSLCGTTAVLPQSLGKLAKILAVPVVVLICHGHHINSPFWDTSHERGVKPTEADYIRLFTAEEVKTATPDEINEKILSAFQYDDFAWQKERGILVKDAKRADGLHKVLYRCPACNTEYKMGSEGTKLFCKACGKEWEMQENGSLQAVSGETEYAHIPDWYEWERACVKAEVEAGTYSTGMLKVQADSLPNSKGYIDIGHGTMTHDMNGFKVTVTDDEGVTRTMEKPVASLYSCHIEYRYLFKKGDCVDLNTLTDTWYVYPEGADFAVTKMALATEELYFKYMRDKGVTLPEGLA